MAPPLLVTFAAGTTGSWSIDRIDAVVGESLAQAARLSVSEGSAFDTAPHSVWALHGSTGNTRYTTGAEVQSLSAKQEGLARPQASCAALIPIRKSDAWWTLAQDARRAIFEEQSRHIGIGLDYLPGVARRLHHSRELGEPFDFLTWFEYAPADSDAFEDLVRRLRATEEWAYVEREVDIRLTRV